LIRLARHHQYSWKNFSLQFYRTTQGKYPGTILLTLDVYV
jgi:hypothetical protein